MAAKLAQTTVPATMWRPELEERHNNEVGSCKIRETAGREQASSKDALWSGDRDRQATVPDGLREAAGGGGGGQNNSGPGGSTGGGGRDNDGNGDDEDGNGDDGDGVAVQAVDASERQKSAKLSPRHSFPKRKPDGSVVTVIVR